MVQDSFLISKDYVNRRYAQSAKGLDDLLNLIAKAAKGLGKAGLFVCVIR